jgi:hypothetical protein
VISNCKLNSLFYLQLNLLLSANLLLKTLLNLLLTVKSLPNVSGIFSSKFTLSSKFSGEFSSEFQFALKFATNYANTKCSFLPLFLCAHINALNVGPVVLVHILVSFLSCILAYRYYVVHHLKVLM